MTIKEVMPSVLRMVPIENTISEKKNPLENAITNVIERTEKLREMISSNPIEPQVQSIESSVTGIVMPFVSGGYQNYAGFFSDERAEWMTPQLINELCQSIQQQLEMVQKALTSVLERHTSNRELLVEMKKHLLEQAHYVRSEFGIEVPLKIDVGGQAAGGAAAAHARRDTRRWGRRATMAPAQRDSLTEGSGGSPFGSTSTVMDNTSLSETDDRFTSNASLEQSLTPSPVPPPRPMTLLSSHSETPPPTPVRVSFFPQARDRYPQPPPLPPHNHGGPSPEPGSPPALPPRASHAS